MTSINIDTDNKSDLTELEALAAKKGWHLSYSKNAIDLGIDDKEKKKHLSELLRVQAQKGGLKSFGDDPSEWQRSQRNDKPLYGRE
jgi:hypothetical protein